MRDIKGLVESNEVGFTLTQAGWDYLGTKPDPMDAAQLREHYRGILRAGAKRMFDALVASYPDGYTREDLAEVAEISLAGGTFGAYLGDLVRNGLAEKKGDIIVATETVFIGAA
jgi:uncharacterized protein